VAGHDGPSALLAVIAVAPAAVRERLLRAHSLLVADHVANDLARGGSAQ
jgi:hypothetical protein